MAFLDMPGERALLLTEIENLRRCVAMHAYLNEQAEHQAALAAAQREAFGAQAAEVRSTLRQAVERFNAEAVLLGEPTIEESI